MKHTTSLPALRHTGLTDRPYSKTIFKTVGTVTALVVVGCMTADPASAGDLFANVTSATGKVSKLFTDTLRPLLVLGIGGAAALGIGIHKEGIWPRLSAGLVGSGMAYYLLDAFQ